MTLAVVTKQGNRPFPPRRSAFTSVFWKELAQGRLMTIKCNACRKLTFPPKPFCPHCWSKDVGWTALDPTGRIYSYTVIHATPAAFAAETPYTVGIIDLSAGLRIATRILDEGAPSLIERPVEIVRVAYKDGDLFAARTRG